MISLPILLLLPVVIMIHASITIRTLHRKDDAPCNVSTIFSFLVFLSHTVMIAGAFVKGDNGGDIYFFVLGCLLAHLLFYFLLPKDK